ncbi:MAG: two-component system response regulator CreB [Fibrobacterales bacterium]
MRKILLVEDEQAIADTVLFALKREGYDCVHSGTIHDAQEAFSDDIDCVILDVGLPDGNGMDLCREIRKTSNVIILFLTARNEEIDRIIGLEIGADDYISKPFSPRELVARVNANLRRIQKQQPTGDPLDENTDSHVVGPFHIHRDRHVISVQGTELTLTKNEYGLLTFLITHPKRVYSRTQLIEAVWDEPGSSLERTVDAHIKSIRKKIKEVSSFDGAIQTHRGFGYSFDWGAE